MSLTGPASYAYLIGCAAFALAAPSAQADKITILHQFTGGADGGAPMTNLTPDHFGNVYGTTQIGGTCTPSPGGCGGTVFRLDRTGKLTTIYNFQSGADGSTPHSGVSLIGGELYGASETFADNVTGTPIWRMHTDGTGFEVLYNIPLEYGADIYSYLQKSKNGGLFGITRFGGPYDHGVFFYLGNLGRFVVLDAFRKGPHGLGSPIDLIEDRAGHLFGSTLDGGPAGVGAVWKFDQTTRAFTVLHVFTNGADGGRPRLGAAADDGTIYGVTQTGSSHDNGAIFSLAPAHGTYAFSVLAPITTGPYPHGYADNPPPSLEKDGTLVGQTVAGFYRWKAGTYSYQLSIGDNVQPDLSTLTPVWHHPGTVLGTSLAGVSSTNCPYNGQFAGCGYIYSATSTH